MVKDEKNHGDGGSYIKTHSRDAKGAAMGDGASVIGNEIQEVSEKRKRRRRHNDEIP